MNYASIIFEVGMEESTAPSTSWGTLLQTLTSTSSAHKADRATLWVAITSDPRWRELIPLNYEEHGFVPIGPMSIADAETSLKNLKVLLGSMGLEVVEQTCSED